MKAQPGSTREQPTQPTQRALLSHVAEIRALRLDDLDAVMDIEQRAYPFPWSRGNFKDSLLAGHRAVGLWLPTAPAEPVEPLALAGYGVSMSGVDERHVLNLTVDPAWQGRGLGQRLLDDLVDHAQACGEARIWLEVRDSNQRAQQLYRRRGFALIGRRRGYYPNGHGQREDAAVMALDLKSQPGSRGAELPGARA
jgi:[ribosomal protein S18]-alanine N-acetyltransferase